MEVKQLGFMDNGTGKHQSNTVYDEKGVCPNITTIEGGGTQQIKVMTKPVRIKQATKEGYIECKVGGVADLSYPTSNTRRGRVQDGGDVCPTLTATETGVCKIERAEVTNEESISEILRVLRKENGEEAFCEWSIRGLWCVLQEEVLRQNVYAESLYENWTHRAELFKFAHHGKSDKQPDYSKESVRDMWKNWETGCSPQRRKLSEQQRREFDDFVQKLPHEATQQKAFV